MTSNQLRLDSDGFFGRGMYEFPKTRYQGSKYKLRKWIRHNLESLEFDTALDAFSGTSSIGYLLKAMGKEVFSNDILPFNYQVSKALVENSNIYITDLDLQNVLTRHPEIEYVFFIKATFSEVYYLDSENEWLDVVVQNIHRIDNEYKKAMLFWALFQSCISKRPYNLFHRKNLYVRTSDVKRSFGNKVTWDKPFEVHMRKFVDEANMAVFDNGKVNIALCDDVLNLDVRADLVYLDPPYIPEKGSLTLYGDFYHFLSGLVCYENWNEQIDFKSNNKKLISEYSVWEDKKNIKNAFKNIIEKFQDSIIVISYRQDGIPSIDEIVSMLEVQNKIVTVKTVDYNYVLSKKQNLKEVLIIGQ